MKESYYTPETIGQKAGELILTASRYAARRRQSGWQLKRPALLVLDMQAYFLESSSHAFVPSGPALMPGISRLLRAFEALRYPVIFTQHQNTPSNAGQMAAWWRDVLSAEHPLAGICPEFEPEKRRVISKSQYDAFYGTNLEDILRENSTNQVLVCGLMTHLCCETTARSAFMRGYEVFFMVDGTATYTEELHRASLLTLAHGFAGLALVDEMLAALENKHAG